MERLTDEEFKTIKKLALETAQATTMSQGSMYEAIKSLCSLMLDSKLLSVYEDIGTPEQFAAYRQAVDFARAKVKEFKERIDIRVGANYHDELKRILVFGERREAYLTVIEAAEAALEAQEGERND